MQFHYSSNSMLKYYIRVCTMQLILKLSGRLIRANKAKLHNKEEKEKQTIKQ